MKGAVRAWLASFNVYRPAEMGRKDGIEPIVLETSRTKARFAQFFMLAFVAFLAWAFYAPMDAGVHVMGTVIVKGNRKAVQHPQGGVVKEIRVREGDVVQEGDTLIRLNPLSLEAELNQTEVEYITALAEESRLNAERVGAPEIKWLRELREYRQNTKVDEVQLLQQQLFASRQKDLLSQVNIYQEQISGFREQITELEKLLPIRRDQLDTANKEVDDALALAKEGYIPKIQANDAVGRRNELMSSLSATVNDISKARSALAAAQLQIQQVRSSFVKDADAQLYLTQQRRKSLAPKVEASRFNLSLAEVKAPVSGTVVGLKVFTVGGVVGAGNTMMEILPAGEGLIIDAKVPTNLVDKVHKGLEADVRFTAFNQRTTPVVPGQVSLVGVDRLFKGPTDDSATPPEYYLAQVEITKQALDMLKGNFVQAGMPVDVIIKTGERTFMEYLLKPLVDHLAVSFKD